MSEIVSMLSVNEIERQLKNHSDEDGYGNGWSWWADEVNSGEPIEVERLGQVETINTYTGGEGGGEDCELLFKVGDRFFQKVGYYASYDGTYWDGDFSEVRPELKTITVYLAV